MSMARATQNRLARHFGHACHRFASSAIACVEAAIHESLPWGSIRPTKSKDVLFFSQPCQRLRRSMLFKRALAICCFVDGSQRMKMPISVYPHLSNYLFHCGAKMIAVFIHGC